VPVVQFKYTVSPVFRPCAVKVTVIVVEADCAYVPVENVLLNTPTWNVEDELGDITMPFNRVR
jgi:hypothetical protein